MMLRPCDVAKRWLCSERHVRNMLDRKELPFFRLGGKLIRITLEDVEAYEQCQRRMTTSSAATEDHIASSGMTNQAAASAIRSLRRRRASPSTS